MRTIIEMAQATFTQFKKTYQPYIATETTRYDEEHEYYEISFLLQETKDSLSHVYQTKGSLDTCYQFLEDTIRDITRMYEDAKQQADTACATYIARRKPYQFNVSITPQGTHHDITCAIQMTEHDMTYYYTQSGTFTACYAFIEDVIHALCQVPSSTC